MPARRPAAPLLQVVNKLRGIISVCAIKAPGFGERRKALLQARQRRALGELPLYAHFSGGKNLGRWERRGWQPTCWSQAASQRGCVYLCSSAA